MRPDLNQMMRQVQGLQTRMSKIKEQLDNETMEGIAGGGMVKAVVNGKNELVSLTIEKDAIDPNDPEMLQDLVLMAVNQANKAMQARIADEMAKVTGGMRIPGLF